LPTNAISIIAQHSSNNETIQTFVDVLSRELVREMVSKKGGKCCSNNYYKEMPFAPPPTLVNDKRKHCFIATSQTISSSCDLISLHPFLLLSLHPLVAT